MIEYRRFLVLAVEYTESSMRIYIGYPDGFIQLTDNYRRKKKIPSHIVPGDHLFVADKTGKYDSSLKSSENLADVRKEEAI